MILGPYQLRIARSGKRAPRPASVLAIVAGFLVAALPAAPALAVNSISVAVLPTSTGTVAEYDIQFKVASALSAGGTITIQFPKEAAVPASILAADVRVSSPTDCAGGSAPTSAPTIVAATATVGALVTLSTPVSVPATGFACVRFLPGASIRNPAVAGSYTLTVKTSTEATPVTSPSFVIGSSGAAQGTVNLQPPPTISVSLSPPNLAYNQNCVDNAIPGNVMTGLSIPNGTCDTGGFGVFVSVGGIGSAIVKVAGTNAVPNAPATGTGWTLCQPTAVEVQCGTAAAPNPGLNQFSNNIGSGFFNTATLEAPTDDAAADVVVGVLGAPSNPSFKGGTIAVTSTVSGTTADLSMTYTPTGGSAHLVGTSSGLSGGNTYCFSIGCLELAGPLPADGTYTDVITVTDTPPGLALKKAFQTDTRFGTNGVITGSENQFTVARMKASSNSDTAASNDPNRGFSTQIVWLAVAA